MLPSVATGPQSPRLQTSLSASTHAPAIPTPQYSSMVNLLECSEVGPGVLTEPRKTQTCYIWASSILGTQEVHKKHSKDDVQI